MEIQRNIIVEENETYKVDRDYIKRALAALEELKKTDKFMYDNAVKYLDTNKGKLLVLNPEEFAARRISLAAGDSSSPSQSREELMKSVADKNKAASGAGPKDQVIKSIWVKSLDDSKAVLAIEYVDGKKEDVETDAAFDETDRYYKQMAQLLRASHRSMKKGYVPVNHRDVQLAIICAPYNDARIEWFFGKNRKPKSAWKYGIVILDKKSRELEQFKKMMAKKLQSTVSKLKPEFGIG